MLQLINDNPAALAAAQAGNWSACVSALNSDTVTVRDETGWKLGDISDRWGDDAARVVSGTLDTAGQSDPLAKAAWTALLSEDGLRLHTDDRQTLINQLATIGWNGQAWSDELRDGIKSLGVQTVSRWKQATGTEPTEQAVQTTWEAGQVNTFDRHALQLSVNRRGNGKLSLNAILRQVGTTAGGADVDGSKSVLAVADASAPRDDPREQALVDAITAAVEAYIAGAN